METEKPILSKQFSAAAEIISLPAPTAWPIVFALGLTLLLTGLVTSASVSVLGAILVLFGCVGWFRDVLPQEKHQTVTVVDRPAVVETTRREVARLPVAPELPRAYLPLETYPISAGIRGGLAGSVVMAVLACLFGIVKFKSIWYPINLLAACAYVQSAAVSAPELTSFHLTSFILASVLHLATSLLVGLLYGAMLPMLPRRPILLGGLIAPIMWSGLLYTILGIINPLMEKQINWTWFVITQIGFGIVAGAVVANQEKVHTRQNLPFAMRAGIEGSWDPDQKENEGKRQ